MGGSLVTPYWGSGFLFFPLGKWVHGYSSSGEMVIGYVLPTGKVGLWLLLLGEMLIGYVLPAGEVGLMVTPRWGKEWVAWLFPVGGEGGLHGTKYSFVSIISVCTVVCDFL